MKQIAILGHWHTGTSLVARAFNGCGMELGNENTFWSPNEQYEHGLLNQMGDQLVLGNITEEGAGRVIEEVLESYVEEGKRLGWDCYGVKITHALHPCSYPIFRRLFFKCWKNVEFVLCVRHILGIIESTRRDEGWGTKGVIESWKSTLKGFNELWSEGAVVFVYPNDWLGIKSETQRKMEEMGFIWNEKAKDLFSYDRPKRINEIKLLDYYSWESEWGENGY